MRNITGTSQSVSRGKSPDRNNEKKYIVTEQQLQTLVPSKQTGLAVMLELEEYKEDLSHSDRMKTMKDSYEESIWSGRPQQSMSKAVKERFSEVDKAIERLGEEVVLNRIQHFDNLVEALTKVAKDFKQDKQ